MNQGGKRGTVILYEDVKNDKEICEYRTYMRTER